MLYKLHILLMIRFGYSNEKKIVSTRTIFLSHIKVWNKCPKASMELPVSLTLTFCLPSVARIPCQFMVQDGSPSSSQHVHVPARRREEKGRAHNPFKDTLHKFNTQFPLKSCWPEFSHMTRPFSKKAVKCSILSRCVFTSRLLKVFFNPPDLDIP